MEMTLLSMDCVQRTNIQNLKAIHNRLSNLKQTLIIVFKERIYKIWKQFTTGLSTDLAAAVLCSKNEYTKSESNSQPFVLLTLCNSIVFKERIYKIWKQFTTDRRAGKAVPRLCSKNEYTKSESNSQPGSLSDFLGRNCVQRTNIQNLKAIHNQIGDFAFPLLIVFKERIYKIWKQFTTGLVAVWNK